MLYQANIEAFGRVLEIFYKKVDDAYHVWLVSEGVLLNHYMTPGNPKAGISFVNMPPLEWFEISDIPSVIEKNPVASKIKSNRACFDPIYESKLARKAWNNSKKHIIATWQDDSVSFTLGANNEFILNTTVPVGHVLSSISELSPTFWDYKSWYLSIGGDSGGLRFPTLGCIGGDMLAIKLSGKGPIAHVFAKGK